MQYSGRKGKSLVFQKSVLIGITGVGSEFTKVRLNSVYLLLVFITILRVVSLKS